MSDVRQCGINLNYWWPVAHERTFPKTGLLGARLGNMEFLVVRRTHGEFAVFEDACPHKRVRLSRFGQFSGHELVCEYHGWRYCPQSGDCLSTDAMSGRKEKLGLSAYPVQRYGGWIWVFPGDPDLEENTELPTIPPLLEPKRYHRIPMEGTVGCHYSYITENATDLFHATLHRSQQPWTNPQLVSLVHDDHMVQATYQVETPHPLANLFSRSPKTHVVVRYEYPYIHIYQEDKRFYLFVVYLPTAPQHTYVHSTFFFRKPKGTRILLKLLHPLLKYAIFQKVFAQDIRAVEEEQRAYNLLGEDGSLETNPVSHAVRQVMLKQTQHQAVLKEEPLLLTPGSPL